jgi:hypothetical protein
VLAFLVALAHALFMVEWYIARGALADLPAELANWPDYAKFIGFPFKALGLAALLILFLMAATSHDYWLSLLTPAVWKALHMGVYLAFGLVVLHVALGVVQFEVSLRPGIMVGVRFVLVTALHLLAGWRERRLDAGTGHNPQGLAGGRGRPKSIPDKAARIVTAAGGERIAVFRDGRQIGAGQQPVRPPERAAGRGPHRRRLHHLPRGTAIQYRLADGCAPPPVHREARHLPRAPEARHPRGRPAPPAARARRPRSSATSPWSPTDVRRLGTSRKDLRAALLATDLCLYGLHAARQPGQSVEFRALDDCAADRAFHRHSRPSAELHAG